MAATVDSVLSRLIDARLIPLLPISGKQPNSPLRRQTSHMSLAKTLENPSDPDATDPKWFEVFHSQFIAHADPRQDDLLFFVRCVGKHPPPNSIAASSIYAPSSNPSNLSASSRGPSRQSSTDNMKQSLADPSADPVFVRRKMFKPQPTLPTLPDNTVILWRDTFFLNLIVHLPCRLTVAVCRRALSQPSSQTAASSASRPVTRHSMTSTRAQVSRRVFAMPTRSRVDVKESRWECSWPLIYYAVEDFREVFEGLTVREDEYLCVELSTTLLGAPGSTSGKSKIILFHGAASYASLLDIYKQRSTERHGNTVESMTSNGHPANGSTQNGEVSTRRFRVGGQNTSATSGHLSRTTTIESSASAEKVGSSSRLGTAASYFSARSWANAWGFSSTSLSTEGDADPSTEYVLMQGPGGKGHAQVAITLTQETISVKSPGSHGLNGTMQRPTTRNGRSRANSTVPTTDVERVRDFDDVRSVPTGKEREKHGISGRHDVSSSGGSGIFQTFKRWATFGRSAATEDAVSESKSKYDHEEASKTVKRRSRAATSATAHHRQSILNVLPQSEEIVEEPTNVDESPREPVVAVVESLKCSMTFVNVPWTSIVTDLVNHTRKRRGM